MYIDVEVTGEVYVKVDVYVYSSRGIGIDVARGLVWCTGRCRDNGRCRYIARSRGMGKDICRGKARGNWRGSGIRRSRGKSQSR